MAKLKNEKRPTGQSADYRFVRNDESGRAFKAKHALATDAKGKPALIITISPVGEDGHALPNEGGLPDVSSHSHTFTDVELSAKDFDLEARVASILAVAVDAKEQELKSRESIQAFGEKWRGEAALRIEKTAEELAAAGVVSSSSSAPIAPQLPRK